jgi:Arc/MetJ family transcription regulator
MRNNRYYVVMKRTTIAITDDLALALEVEAKRTGESVSAIARRALEEHLGTESGGRRKLGFAALGASGKNSVGRDMEELLEESGFGEPRDS